MWARFNVLVFCLMLRFRSWSPLCRVTIFFNYTVPTEWTDQVGSKVEMGRTSLVMLLSVIRLRLYYSPLYRWLAPLRPLEAWLYRKLSAPPPLQ